MSSVDKLAQKVIVAYAHDPEGLTREECVSFTETEDQAKALCFALKTGRGGEITQEERASLAGVGFSDEFIQGIAGEDGNRALRERAKWLTYKLQSWNRDVFIRELGHIGPVTPEVVPALIAALKDENDAVRANAAEALGRIGPVTPEVIPALIEALEDEDTKVRNSAAETLGAVGPAAKDAVPALIAALKDENDAVRANAAEALGRIGPEAKAAVPALIAALKDEDKFVREAAVNTLSLIGHPAVPALTEAHKDSDEDVRVAADEALRNIRGDVPFFSIRVGASIHSFKRWNEFVTSFDGDRTALIIDSDFGWNAISRYDESSGWHLLAGPRIGGSIINYLSTPKSDSQLTSESRPEATEGTDEHFNVEGPADLGGYEGRLGFFVMVSYYRLVFHTTTFFNYTNLNHDHMFGPTIEAAITFLAANETIGFSFNIRNSLLMDKSFDPEKHFATMGFGLGFFVLSK